VSKVLVDASGGKCGYLLGFLNNPSNFCVPTDVRQLGGKVGGNFWSKVIEELLGPFSPSPRWRRGKS